MLLYATGHKTYYGYISVLGVGSLSYLPVWTDDLLKKLVDIKDIWGYHV